LQVLDDFSDMHIDQEKKTFDRKVKMVNFQFCDCVLKWDALKEKEGNHDALWIGLLVISQVQMSNNFILHNLEGEGVFDGPLNGQSFKLYFIKALKPWYYKYVFSSFYFMLNRLHAQWNT